MVDLAAVIKSTNPEFYVDLIAAGSEK